MRVVMLELVERALKASDGDWLLGDVGLADCAMAGLTALIRLVDFGKCGFVGIALMDAEVKARFGETVEPALAGELDAWTSTTRGRLVPARVTIAEPFFRLRSGRDPLLGPRRGNSGTSGRKEGARAGECKG
jgi:hypothetical protein